MTKLLNPPPTRLLRYISTIACYGKNVISRVSKCRMLFIEFIVFITIFINSVF